MKKIIYSTIVAGLALVSAACQKLDEQIVTPDSSNALTVTGSIVNFDGTKVSYAFTDPENVKSGIKPTWDVGDNIFGFDEAGTTFTFTVLSVDEETGKANFDTSGSGSLTGKLYAIYYPGKSVSDIESKTLAVDLSTQSGKLDGNAPAIMCATGEIKDNAVNFAFTNQAAIVGIYKMQVFNNGSPVGPDKTVSAVKLKGATVDGTIQVKDGVLTLVAGTKTEDLTADVSFTTTGEEGYVDVDSKAIAPYFAVIPAANASLTIEATCEGSTCKTNAAITGKINAGQYYYLGKKIYGGKVATIGSTEYATISEAFAAVKGGETITLEADCDFDSQITLANKTGEITLDLNGHILKNGPTLNGKQSRFYLNTDAKLIIRDSQNDGGTITSDKADQDIIRIIKGNLLVASGTISAPAATNGGNAAIWVEPASTGTTTNASVTIQGTANIQGPATVATSGKHAYALYVENPEAAISVTGGTFSAESNSMRVIDAESVDITGGTFVCNTDGQFTLRFASDGKNYICNISGTAEVKSSKTNAVRAYGDEGLTVNISGGKYNSGTYIPINTEVKDGTDGPTISITGGMYSREPKAEFVAKNYESANNTDQTTKGDYPYMVKKYQKVATLTVGSGAPQDFSSVEAAVAEANKATEDCTIKLTASSTVGGQPTVTNKNATVTLDLAGFKLTYGGYDRIRVNEDDARLIITDSSEEGTGEIEQIATEQGAISHAKGTLTISGGKIYNTSSSTVSTVNLSGGTLNVTGGLITLDVEEQCTITASGGTLNLTNGEISATQAKTPGISMSGTSIVKVEGTGKITSISNAISASKGTLTINSGYFKSTGDAAVINKTTGSIATFNVYGGYYNKSVKDEYLTSGEYVCVSEPDDSRPGYNYVVKKASEAPDVATLTVGSTSTNFKSVEDAVTEANKATQACTITLTASPTVGKAVYVTNSYGVTLDLNSKTLKHDGGKRIGLSGSGKLTIVDNGTGGTIIQTNASSSNITYGSGTLTIEGGTITKVSGSTYNTVNLTGGTLTVKGGEITNTAVQSSQVITDRATIAVSGGSVTVSGGKISSNGGCAIAVSGEATLNVTENGEIEAQSIEAGNAIYLGAGTGNITISGGYIHSQKATINITGSSQHKLTLSGDCTVASLGGSNALYSISTATEPNSTVTVNGGKYSCPNKAVFSVGSPTSGTVSTQYIINSCIYNGTIAASRLDDFHKSVDNDDPATKDDYPNKIVEYIPVTLRIGSGDPQPYASVETAVEQANKESQACKITLNDDLTVETAAEVTNSQGVTLDLNGKTLTTGATTTRIGVSGDGVLTIDDSASGGNITTSANNQVFSYSSGEVILNKGTIIGKTSYYPVKVTGSGKFTINSGEITSPGGAAIILEGATAKVTLNDGGTLSGAGAAGTVRANQGTFEMNGGTITSSKVAVQVNGDVDCSIKGGTITSTATDTCAIYVNHSDAEVTVNGSDVVITGSKRYGSSVVWLNNGTFTLKNGTIGNIIGTLGTTSSSTDRNYTAVRVVDGTFNMEGGLLVARQQVIQFGKRGDTDSASGNGTATISAGRMVNGASGWQLVQFRTNTENKLTVSGDACLYVAGTNTTIKMFTGSTTTSALPTNTSVTINGGHFDRSPEGITRVTVNGTVATDDRTIGGLVYNYHVE